MYKMDSRFDGKRALVTGGSRGIGKCIVGALIESGAVVFAIAKSQENLERLKSEYPKVKVIGVDLSDWDATRTVVEDLGDIDLLVNNAAILDNDKPVVPFVDTTKGRIDIAIDVNLKAAFNISQIVSRAMIKRPSGGAIVNISSVAGLKPIPGMSAYCISKAGMDMMTKVMALELGPHKIRVNSVSPTKVRTESTHEFIEELEKLPEPYQFHKILQRQPLGMFVEKDDIVQATLFLLSDQA